MNALQSFVGFVLAACLATASATVWAQTDPMLGTREGNSGAPVIYVGDFQTSLPTAADETGLFARKHAAHDDKKIGANVEALPGAVVQALRDKGAVAYRLNSAQPTPTSGWLVDGTYQQTISHTPFPMISSLIQPSKPNTDASIRIVDLSGREGALAGFKTSATLKGQGSSFSTNPYELAAHIVIHRVEASSSMNALANDIADRILAAGQQAGANSSNGYASASLTP